MREKTATRFLDDPVGIALVRNLARWWIEAEGLLMANDVVDHRPSATRERYTKIAFDSRSPTASQSSRSERKAADACFEAFATWASSNSARQVRGWLRDAMRRTSEPLSPNRLGPRVEREISDAIRQRSPRLRHTGVEKFDPSANLDFVVESSRTTSSNNWGS